jgi:SAM-dependent methyltransferase
MCWCVEAARMFRADPYPERRAGGFTRVDGSVQFYLRVHALLESLGPDPVVLDFGAGRGANLDSALPIHRHLLDLRSKATVIGVDVDGSVLENPNLDDAHVVQEASRLPFDDRSVDLVLADHAFEHVSNPMAVAGELRRVVREGGWICARTPNKWGYIAVAARVVPNRLHVAALRRIQPRRQQRDVFPTRYRLNTRRDIALQFPSMEFDQVIYGWEPEPAYLAASLWTAGAFRLLGRLTPERFRPILLVFIHRRATLRPKPILPRSAE